jgi:hypothetical protein
MYTKSHKVVTPLGLFRLISFAFPSNKAAEKALPGYDPTYQTQALLYDKTLAVHLGTPFIQLSSVNKASNYYMDCLVFIA